MSITATDSGALAIAVPRHREIARALRAAARQARAPDFWTGGGGMSARYGQRTFFLGLAGAFLLLVALPIVSSGVYLWLIASDQYASEARFAVRGGSIPKLDAIGALTGIPSINQIQDSLIVANFIRSRGMVERLEENVDLRDLYSKPGVDWLSRFRKDDSRESLVWYWRWRMVDVSIESMSGIISVTVRAFSAPDALNIANAVVSISERLANSLSERARTDAYRQTQAQLDRAGKNLQDKIVAMRDLRNSEGVLDATKTAEAMTKMQTELKLALLREEDEYTVQRHSVSADSPQMKVLAARIKSLRSQIQQLDDQMTQSAGTTTAALSTTMGQFERQKLDRDVAQKQYLEASAAFERARIEATTQQIYITSFLRPVLAQEALYPRRMFIWLGISVAAILLYTMLAGAAVMTRNYLAV